MLGKCTNPNTKLTESDAQLWMVRSLEKVLEKLKLKLCVPKLLTKLNTQDQEKKNQTKKGTKFMCTNSMQV